ncbi:MAG: hypothetical protein QM628_17560 [Propionicimonas sp.]
MDTDLLLTWMSETGAGAVRGLSDRLAWYMRSRNFTPERRSTGRWLRDISALGHAEIDWGNDRWAIAPAAAALLPAAGGTAVLAGRRRVGLRDALADSNDLATFERPHAARSSDLPAPTSIFVQSDSIDQLSSVLADIGIQFVGEAATNIAAALAPISLGALAAPPQRGADIEHLDQQSMDVSFVPGPPPSNGLARFKDLGRLHYVYRQNDEWYHTGHAEGVLLDLAAREAGVIRWREERVVDGRGVGRLFVDQGSPLPPLQTRALVLCSGLPVRFSTFAGTAIYRNVPKDVAVLVAQSVHQTVE